MIHESTGFLTDLTVNVDVKSSDPTSDTKMCLMHSEDNALTSLKIETSRRGEFENLTDLLKGCPAHKWLRPSIT